MAQKVLSVRGFAKLAGVSRTTISRHIKEGKLTRAERITIGVPEAELKRYKKT